MSLPTGSRARVITFWREAKHNHNVSIIIVELNDETSLSLPSPVSLPFCLLTDIVRLERAGVSFKTFWQEARHSHEASRESGCEFL